MKAKRKSIVLFILSVIVILSLAVAGFKGFEVAGLEFKSFDEAITKGLDLQGGVSVLMEIQDENVKEEDIEKTKQLIELRVNKIGVSETVVAREGDKRIRVDIPGQSDSKSIVDSLSKTGNLTFKDPNGNVVLEGKDIKKATAHIDQQTTQPVVSLELNDAGAKKFSDATGRLVGQKISINMDDKEISAPMVKVQITNGQAMIDGSKTIEEAQELAGLINAGALPVEVKAVSVKTIGSQLGAEALPNALKAGAIGLGLIFIFMAIYYRLPGIIASISLILYTTITLITFAETNVTLTLPGIAGFVLTIGMAIDANILIFERLKEEVKNGVPIKVSLKNGFENATSSIIDSNATTLIAGLVLYYVGSGAVKGFAVTLIIGIVISLFTALVVTKFLMNQAVECGLIKQDLKFGIGRGKKNA